MKIGFILESNEDSQKHLLQLLILGLIQTSMGYLTCKCELFYGNIQYTYAIIWGVLIIV